MPLKYGLGMPEMTNWAVWIHGILFMLYTVFAMYVGSREKWGYSTFMQGSVSKLRTE